MKLTEISLARPVTVFMFFACLTIVGIMGARQLPLEFLPDIEFPGLQVNIPYRNSTPEEVERRIARPVEEALATLSGIERMNSTSRDDGAQIELGFKIGEDMAVKGVEARDKIDAIRASLPADIERIQVQKFAAGDIPMLTFRISADRDLQSGYDMLERNLKRRIERLPGVSRVDLYGVEKKEIRIELAADRVAAHGVDLRQLAETLRAANFALAAGDVLEAGRRYYVKPEGRFARIGDIETFVVNRQGLRLADIADIRYTQPRQTYERHLNQRYAIGLSVFKESGANLVETSDRVMVEVEEVKRLPEMAGIALVLFDDQSTSVRTSLRDLVEAGLIGALMSLVVLYLFLRDWRTTFIVTTSVPLSLVITLAAMFFLGYSLNILSLMGLMLSVGMLVDNAVVVNEAIFKARAEHPENPAGATLAGVNSVGLAVTLGTLTTAIVFLPNIFGAQDEMTLYLSHVAVTICISLAASLLVAVTLIPQLTTRIPPTVKGGTRWMERLAGRYVRVLDWTLHHRGWTALFIVLTLASVAVPAAMVKADMFPQDGSKRLFLDYNLNSTYPLDTVRRSVNTIEAYLAANQDRFEMETSYSYFDIGRAFTLVYLKDETARTKTPQQIQDEIRKDLPKIAIGEPTFDISRGGGKDKLAMQVLGESSERLREVANEVAGLMRGLPGIADVRVNAGASGWEMRVRVDRDKARLYGLSSQQVAEVVAGAMRGTPLKPFRAANGEIELVLEMRREDRTDIDALRALPLVTPSGQRIPLSTVAELSIGDVPGDIRRENRRTAIAINFSTAEGVTADDAKQRVEQVLNQLQFPAGYSWGYGRAFDDDAQSQQTMLTNMLLALACIYIVMAALFESVLAPSAIITGIFFSFVGVYWFFFATGTTFSFMAMIGMLVLMGVVVNNGIVLIDHVHQLREAGLTRERALVQGSRDRLRPILMTAASTILAMVPLALGDTTIGGDGPAYFPLARAVIGGLAFATVVSLIVLPTIYLMLDDLGHWGRRVFRVAAGRPLAPEIARDG
ncbi:MAG: efflux RND transporter permease subunit [Gammaproteobacteria bacterium]|nr:efflux RND transporter permease subunit [Gammaproteobacteria bacterium]